MQNNFFSLLSMLSNVQNPQAFIQQMVRSNPNLKGAYDKTMEVVNSGQNVEQYTKNIMQTQNINLNNLQKMASQFLPH